MKPRKWHCTRTEFWVKLTFLPLRARNWTSSIYNLAIAFYVIVSITFRWQSMYSSENLYTRVRRFWKASPLRWYLSTPFVRRPTVSPQGRDGMCFRQNRLTAWLPLSILRNKKSIRWAPQRLTVLWTFFWAIRHKRSTESILQDGDVKKHISWVHCDWNYHSYVCRCHCYMWRNFGQKAIWSSGRFCWALVAFCKF